MERVLHKHRTTSERLRRAAPVALVYGLAADVVINLALVLVGDRILPAADTAAGRLVVVGAALASGALAVVLFRDFARRTGVGGVEGGLLFGAIVGGQGLLVDGIVLLGGGFAFPGLDRSSTETLAVALLLSWGLVVVAPAAWAVATGRE